MESLALAPLAVSTRQACTMIGVSHTTLYGLLKTGQLARVKIGGRTLVPIGGTRGIKALIERNEEQPRVPRGPGRPRKAVSTTAAPR